MWSLSEVETSEVETSEVETSETTMPEQIRCNQSQHKGKPSLLALMCPKIRQVWMLVFSHFSKVPLLSKEGLGGVSFYPHTPICSKQFCNTRRGQIAGNPLLRGVGVCVMLNTGTNCDFPCLQIALGIRSLSGVETIMPESGHVVSVLILLWAAYSNSIIILRICGLVGKLKRLGEESRKRGAFVH